MTGDIIMDGNNIVWSRIPTNNNDIVNKNYVDTYALLIWHNLNDLIDKPGALANLTEVSVGNAGNVLMWNGTTATYTKIKTHTIDPYAETDYNNLNRLITKTDYTSFVNN